MTMNFGGSKPKEKQNRTELKQLYCLRMVEAKWAPQEAGGVDGPLRGNTLITALHRDSFLQTLQEFDFWL